jgi:hypothetical protein
MVQHNRTTLCPSSNNEAALVATRRLPVMPLMGTGRGNRCCLTRLSEMVRFAFCKCVRKVAYIMVGGQSSLHCFL